MNGSHVKSDPPRAIGSIFARIMTKTLFICLMSLTILLPAYGNDEGTSDYDPSAKELAHHLGVSSWVTKIKLEGSIHILEIFYVKSGELGKSALSCPLDPTDREYTRFAIHYSSETLKDPYLSIKTPSIGIRGGNEITDLVGICRLPTPILPGDYVLGGDLENGAFAKGIGKQTIKDIKSGLLLRIIKKP